MNRQQMLKAAVGLVMVGWLMLACSLINQAPGEEGATDVVANLDATATEIAREIFATQTAAAPVDTPTAPATDTPQSTDTPEPTPTDTPTPEPTDTPRPTDTPVPSPTPEPDLVVEAESLNVRSGPGTAYDIVAAVKEGDTLVVLGQAYDCAWLLVELPGGDEGWITGAAEYVDLNLSCGEIDPAEIPPVPTQVVQPTATPDNRPTANLIVINDTGENLYIQLSGPAFYEFNVPAGTHTYTVVMGTYNYTVRGCGGAVDTGTITIDGDVDWSWWCG
jgi:hypothetical protein